MAVKRRQSISISVVGLFCILLFFYLLLFSCTRQLKANSSHPHIHINIYAITIFSKKPIKYISKETWNNVTVLQCSLQSEALFCNTLSLVAEKKKITVLPIHDDTALLPQMVAEYSCIRLCKSSPCVFKEAVCANMTDWLREHKPVVWGAAWNIIVMTVRQTQA